MQTRPKELNMIVSTTKKTPKNAMVSSNAGFCVTWECRSEGLKFEIVELVAILHNVALDLGRIDPGDKVFHVPGPC
jgi:hypothetical protein